MKVVVTVPSDFLKRINALIEKGDYESIEDFVQISIINQLNIENDVVHQNEKNIASQIMPSHTILPHLSSGFSLLPDYKKIKTIDPPLDLHLEKGIMWGQYNRIFPIKLTVRFLANTLSDGKETVMLEEFSEKVAELARRTGIQLLDVDKTKKRSRGDKMSTALPIGDNPYKSKIRFKNHFVGYLDSNNVIIGAPGKLKFISLLKENDVKIGITKFGLEFALLKNPILDDDIYSDGSLSSEEIKYYINHLKENVPSEYDSIKNILNSVNGRLNTPADLDKKILETNKNLTKSKASIMRGGLVSRMLELGLLVSKRIGMRNIIYEITEEGLILLQEDV